MAAETTPPPLALAGLFKAAPPGVERALMALSAAESLTDETAAKLYTLSPIEELRAEHFIEALHYSSFVGLRNSEWHIVPEAREWLNAQLVTHPELARRAHETLLALADEADPADAGETVPSYLFTGAGRAYHRAALDPEEGLREYAAAYRSRLTGEQWLLARLAVEQQERGVLPARALEPAFLQGMVSYREEDFATAERLLSRVAASEERRQEVAIAAHLVGHMWRHRGDSREAEILFRKSLDIGRELGDRRGVAQVLHSLANLIGRRQPDEAERLYRESLGIERELGNRHGVAQVLHSLANLIGRRQPDEAERLYRESLDIGHELGNRHHVAQVLHSLANLIGRRRPDEAEQLYRESLDIGRELGNRHHMAQVLHSLANLIGRRQPDEAERLYRESLDIGHELGNRHHVAQVLHSLANLIGRRQPDEAERLYRESLDIERELGNRHGIAQVENSLGGLFRGLRRWSDAQSAYERALEISDDPRTHAVAHLARISQTRMRD